MNIQPNEIKLARAWLGLSQSELAAAMDVTVLTIKHWEAGRRNCGGPAAVLLNLMVAQPSVTTGPTRPRYKDIDAEDWGACSGYDAVELKYDGHYAEFIGGCDGWKLYSRGGTVVGSGSDPVPRCTVLCERITGTEWACNSGLRDSLIAWSAVDTSGNHLSRANLERLVTALVDAGIDIDISEQAKATDAKDLWGYAVLKRGWEGLVLRTKGGKFARMKHRTTVDYVITGYDGTSITGGLYNGGDHVVDRVRVPYSGSPPALNCDVFEASGLSRTASGSLRNPRFERWRDDKDPRECI